MKSRSSLFILLLVAFVDFIGVGLVFPLFATWLFDPSIPLLSKEASNLMRGFWLALLIGIAPLVQVFSAPILGYFSDQIGRKKTLLLGLSFGIIAYLIGILGITSQNLSLLLLYRFFFGISSGTMAVAQASLADISTPETKAKNFVLYSVALGLGFTLGPFLGGKLSDPSFSSWFNNSSSLILGMVLTLSNLILISWAFKETKTSSSQGKINLWKGIHEIYKAFSHPTLRFAFLGFFIYQFGWDYMVEFISLILRDFFRFTTSDVGNFYAYMGLTYALATGLFVRPLVARFSPIKLLFVSMLSGGVFLYLFSAFSTPAGFWVFMPIINFMMALYYPLAATFISDLSSESSQGETLGVYHSVQSIALILSPVFSPLAGTMSMMPIYLGGGLMLVGSLIFTVNYLWKVRQHLPAV